MEVMKQLPQRMIRDLVAQRDVRKRSRRSLPRSASAATASPRRRSAATSASWGSSRSSATAPTSMPCRPGWRSPTPPGEDRVRVAAARTSRRGGGVGHDGHRPRAPGVRPPDRGRPRPRPMARRGGKRERRRHGLHRLPRRVGATPRAGAGELAGVGPGHRRAGARARRPAPFHFASGPPAGYHTPARTRRRWRARRPGVRCRFRRFPRRAQAGRAPRGSNDT